MPSVKNHTKDKKEIAEMSAMQALRYFFSDSRELSMGELKELDSASRNELGTQAKELMLADFE